MQQNLTKYLLIFHGQIKFAFSPVFKPRTKKICAHKYDKNLTEKEIKYWKNKPAESQMEEKNSTDFWQEMDIMTTFYLLHTFVMFFISTNCLYADWFLHSPIPLDWRRNPCTFTLWSNTHIYRESKAAASTETTMSITNGMAGQHTTTYSTGHSASHHKKSIILYSARHERVMTFRHESVPSLNSYSCFCTVL